MISLKDVKVREDKIKSSSLKRHIDVASKEVQRIWSNEKPRVFPGTKLKRDVKAATNFKSKEEMMSFIVLVCNRDWDVMTTSII